MTWEVYTYAGPDGVPFYVGSGAMGRSQRHLKVRPASRGLAAKLAELAAAGQTPTIQIVATFGDDQDARIAEYHLIQHLRPNGTLVNKVIGLKPILGAVRTQAPGNKSVRVSLALEESLWDKIEHYRQVTGGVTQAEAVRRLLSDALRAARKKGSRDA